MAEQMLLQMDPSLAADYKSASQKTRVITEQWVGKSMYCPRCGNAHIAQYENNKPVADFYCPQCGNQFELKSKNGAFPEKINDGAYASMIQRITGMNNPDFFFMSYSKANWTVRNFYFVPKHFFTPEIIEKRSPLASTARRKGWTGCNILIGKIPTTGRIPVVENSFPTGKADVLEKVKKADRLYVANIEARGWLLDILSCVERLPDRNFLLSQMYEFETELSAKHPENHNIRPKIRQQLQFLRDRGIIEFVKPGEYRKVI